MKAATNTTMIVSKPQSLTVTTGLELEHKLTRKGALDSLLYFPTRVVTGLIGLLTVTVLTKYWSPAEYGLYALAIGVQGILATATGQWIELAIVRFLPHYRQKRRLGAFLHALLAAGGGGIVAVVIAGSVLLAVVQTRSNNGLWPLLWLTLLGIPGLNAFAALTEAYRAQGRSVMYSALTLLRGLGGFVAGVALAVACGLGPAGMIAGPLIVLLLVAFGYAVRNREQLRKLLSATQVMPEILRQTLAYALPLVGLNVAAMALSVLDRYLIKGFLTLEAVGIYSIGYTVAEGSMRLIPTTLVSALGPVVYSTWEEHGPGAAFRTLNRFMRYYVILASPCALVFVLMKDTILDIFVSQDLQAASSVMAIVSLSIAAHGFTLLLNIVFLSIKKTKIPFKNFVIAVASNVVLNCLLLPRFGYIGAAWATLASYFLLLVLTVMAAKRSTDFRLERIPLSKILVACAAMAAVIKMVASPANEPIVNVLSAGAAGVLCYAAVIALTGAVAKHEWQALLRKKLV